MERIRNLILSMWRYSRSSVLRRSAFYLITILLVAITWEGVRIAAKGFLQERYANLESRLLYSDQEVKSDIPNTVKRILPRGTRITVIRSTQDEFYYLVEHGRVTGIVDFRTPVGRLATATSGGDTRASRPKRGKTAPAPDLKISDTEQSTSHQSGAEDATPPPQSPPPPPGPIIIESPKFSSTPSDEEMKSVLTNSRLRNSKDKTVSMDCRLNASYRLSDCIREDSPKGIGLIAASKQIDSKYIVDKTSVPADASDVRVRFVIVWKNEWR